MTSMKTFFALSLAASLAAACGDDTSTNPEGGGGQGGEAGGAGAAGGGGAGGQGGEAVGPVVASVVIEPDGFCNLCFELPKGSTRKYLARSLDQDGVEVEAEISWSTDDETRISVAADGTVTALEEGEATLIATAGGVEGTAILTVTPTPIASIDVTPQSVTLDALGATATFTAVARDFEGNEIPDVPFTWLTGNAVVGSIDEAGQLTGLAQGHTLVFAVSGFTQGWAEAVVIDELPLADAWITERLSLGGTHGCAVHGAGELSCWGWNFFGQLGNGENGDTFGYEAVAVEVLGGHTWQAVTTGLYHSCGLTSSGEAHCWGQGAAGELGHGDESVLGSPTPLAVAGGLTFKQLSAGGSHTCGLTTGDDLYCWGGNLGGAVGDGTDVDRFAPVQVAAGSKFTAVATSLWATCAIRDDAAVLCWGTNEQGELGDGSPLGTIVRVPGEVSGGLELTRLDAYAAHFCGVTTTQQLVCWGRNDTGQIGDGSFDPALEPAYVDTADSFVAVTTGGHHTCALSTSGGSYCWGDGAWGQLGGGPLDGSPSPVELAGGLVFVELEAGSHATCGRTSTGASYCWGNSDLGQLGGGLGGAGAASSVPWPMTPPRLGIGASQP